jgi:hypothetical protein
LYFVAVMFVFALFFAGFVLAMQGFIRKEPPNPEAAFFALRWDPDHPGPSHPPERHPGRLLLAGSAMMLIAVLIGLFAL